MHVLILGCGDLGNRVAIQAQHCNWLFTGLRRNIDTLIPQIQAIAADLTQMQPPVDWPEQNFDYVLFMPAPSEMSVEGYRSVFIKGFNHAISWLNSQSQKPKHLFFMSSTSVYGEHQGDWVDEQTRPTPESETAHVLLEAEKNARHCGIPCTVVRLTGLYGPGRSHLVRQVQAGARVPDSPAHFTNRIHVDDAARFLVHMIHRHLDQKKLADTYIVTDDDPANLYDVIEWLRQHMKVTMLPSQTLVRRGGNKRCANTLARETGWRPFYTTFRQGYAELLP